MRQLESSLYVLFMNTLKSCSFIQIPRAGCNCSQPPHVWDTGITSLAQLAWLWAEAKDSPQLRHLADALNPELLTVGKIIQSYNNTAMEVLHQIAILIQQVRLLCRIEQQRKLKKDSLQLQHPNPLPFSSSAGQGGGERQTWAFHCKYVSYRGRHYKWPAGPNVLLKPSGPPECIQHLPVGPVEIMMHWK